MQSKQTQSMNCLIDETPNEMIEELAEQATHWRSEKGLSQEEYNNLFSLLTPENHTLVNKYTQNMHTALAQERHVKHEIDESERKYPELHNYLKVEQQVMDALDIPVEERHRKLDSVKIPIARPMLSSVMRKRVKENIA